MKAGKELRYQANLNDSISPSVYVIYSSIQASASCVALFNSHIPIGSAYTAVTRAYEPNGLSSAICEAENMGAGIEYCISPVDDQDNPAYCFQGIDNGWRQINFSELYDPPPASDLLTRYQSCFPGHSISPDFASMMFVKPQFAFPPDVTDIDPVWATWGGSTCTPVNLGVYDPPRVLQKATALAPVPTPATDPQAEKAPPSPAATLRSPVAAPTKAVSTNDPNSGAKANDPGSNNAGTATPTTAQSDPANAVVDPVDPSVVAQNEGSPATGDNHVVEAGSNSNSDPVASGGSTTPPDTETQSGAKAATNSETNPGTGSGTGNSDPSTAPITLLPQQPADAAKENSGTSGTSGTSGDTGDTVGGTTGGTTGGTNAETSNDSNGGTSGGTTGTNGGTSGDTDSGSSGGTSDGASDSPIGDGNANSAPIALVNSQPITKDTSGNILLSGSTLAPGSTAVFSGHTIVNAPSAIIKDGSTYAPSTSAPSASPLLVNNQLLQMTNGRLKLGSQILEPGTHTTMNNHVIDYANPTQVVEDGVTHNLAPVSSSNPLVLSGQTLLQAPNGGLITAGTTIAPDSAAAIDGHLYSLAGSSSVIMDGKTYALPAATNAYQIQAVTSPPPTVPSGPLTLSNGLVITAQPSTSSDTPQNFLLPNGASLSAGGTAALYSGTTYSLLPSNAGILAAGPSGSFTLTLALPTTTPPPTATNSIFTAASMTFTPEPSGFTLGTTSLTPGGPALTTGGTVLSLGPSGTFVLASSTWLLPPQSIFSAAGATFTAEPTGFNIGTLTSLAPGDAAFSTDGTVVSLGTDSLLHLGSKTYSLVAAPPRSVFTLDNGETFTAAATGFEIAGTEVSPGGRGVLEGGVTVALGTGGVLEVGSLTVTLVGGTSTRGLGGAIVSGLNGGGGGSGGVFEGGAARWRGRERGGWGAGWLGVVVGVGVGVVAVVL